MRWGSKSRKTVFILGAGATRGAVPYVVVNLKRIKPPLNRDFFEVLETLARSERDDGHRIRSRFDRLQKALKNDFPIRGQSTMLMETAFSLLYISKDFPDIFAGAAGRPREAGARTEIEDFLRLTFNLLNTIASRASKDNLYARLVRALEPQDTLITLNYDTVLDSALLSQGWNPVAGYCLPGGPQKYGWKMARPPLAQHLLNVRLLKLHGSLNWQVRGNYKEIHKVFEAKPSRVILTDSPGVNEVSGYIRQIIPPIYGKFFQHPHWQHLWHKAYNSVVDAEAIVIIGCSLVDTDFHLVGILSRAMKEKKRKNRRFSHCILVDRSKIRKKWCQLLKGRIGKPRTFRGFSGFETELARKNRQR